MNSRKFTMLVEVAQVNHSSERRKIDKRMDFQPKSRHKFKINVDKQERNGEELHWLASLVSLSIRSSGGFALS